MKVSKKENEFGMQIFLEEDNSYLTIFYGGNLDLYWSIHSKKRSIDNDSKTDSIIITKENYALYSLFESLYSDIEDINLFEDFEEDKDRYRVYNRSNYQELFDKDNKIITWYSDETAREVANYLRIKKEKDSFVISFYIQEYIEGYDRDFASLYDIPVRFRNSGSRYDPFNIIFMRMYERLKNIDDIHDYGHQIHIEEYLYEKEHMVLSKKLNDKNKKD